MIHRPAIVVLGILCALAFAPAGAAGKGAKADTDAKEVSGMSIVGNNEAPKSLYIVPWRSSELGGDTSLASGLLNDSATPVDREVFMRELEFYAISSQDRQ